MAQVVGLLGEGGRREREGFVVLFEVDSLEVLDLLGEVGLFGGEGLLWFLWGGALVSRVVLFLLFRLFFPCFLPLVLCYLLHDLILDVSDEFLDVSSCVRGDFGRGGEGGERFDFGEFAFLVFLFEMVVGFLSGGFERGGKGGGVGGEGAERERKGVRGGEKHLNLGDSKI